MIQKRRVHRLAHAVVAAEAERDVRHAAAHLRVRQILLDPLRRADEVDRVVVVLLDPRRHRKNVRIEDDVLGRKPDLVDENAVRPLAHANLFLVARRLPVLIEGHHDNGRAILQHRARVLSKNLLAFLQRDRVHNPLALQALQPRLDHRPLRRVDHERDLRHLRLAAQQLQKARHRGHAVDHALVHAHVDHVGAVLHLLARNRHALFVLAFLDQPRELGRARHVRALANHHEHALLLRERLRS